MLITQGTVAVPGPEGGGRARLPELTGRAGGEGCQLEAVTSGWGMQVTLQEGCGSSLAFRSPAKCFPLLNPKERRVLRGALQTDPWDPDQDGEGRDGQTEGPPDSLPLQSSAFTHSGKSLCPHRGPHNSQE